MSVKLLTELHLEFLSLKGGCTGLYESALVKMSHCWKSRVGDHFCFAFLSLKTCTYWPSCEKTCFVAGE